MNTKRPTIIISNSKSCLTTTWSTLMFPLPCISMGSAYTRVIYGQDSGLRYQEFQRTPPQCYYSNSRNCNSSVRTTGPFFEADFFFSFHMWVLKIQMSKMLLSCPKWGRLSFERFAARPRAPLHNTYITRAMDHIKGEYRSVARRQGGTTSGNDVSRATRPSFIHV